MGLRSIAGAMSFAHLAGLTRPKSAKAEDDKKDDEKEGKRAESGDDEPKDDNKKDASAAADDSDDGDKDDDKKDAKGKRAKADDDEDDDDKKESASAEDDDDEEEMRGKSAAASARRRERARCAAIFGSSHAAKNVALAANLAFKTTLTRNEALAVLRDTPAAMQAVSGRSERNPKLGPAGSGGALSGQAAIAQSWDAAAKKAGALTRR